MTSILLGKKLKRDRTLSLALTGRDKGVLKALLDCRLLTTHQLQLLFFPSYQTAKARLQKLFRAKYIDRIIRPTIFGSKDLVYSLGINGQQALIPETESPLFKRCNQQRLQARKLKELFLDHFIAVNQFRVSATIACGTNGYPISWRYASELKIKTKGLSKAIEVRDPKTGQRLPLIPDALMSIRLTAGKSAHFFLEVERQTPLSSVFEGKIRAYLGFRMSKLYERQPFEVPGFRVLIVSPDIEKTLQAIRKLEPKSMLDMFYVCEPEDITPERFFLPIWSAIDQSNLHLLK